MPEFQGGVVHGCKLLVSNRGKLTPIRLEPPFDFRPAPQPVSAAGIGDRLRKISRATRSVDEKTNAFACPADVCSDIRQGRQPGVRNADDLDALHLLQVVDGRQDGVLQRPGLAIEVDILNSVAGADRRVVTTGLEQLIDQALVLKVGTVDDQGEVKGGHVPALPFVSLPDEGTAG